MARRTETKIGSWTRPSDLACDQLFAPEADPFLPDMATVDWHGKKGVLIWQAADTPSIGMSLLEGSRMTMDVVHGGDAIKDELP